MKKTTVLWMIIILLALSWTVESFYQINKINEMEEQIRSLEIEVDQVNIVNDVYEYQMVHQGEKIEFYKSQFEWTLNELTLWETGQKK